ncbi:FAD-binding oxidoreductase [Desulfovermiculus halophilus]|jgi:glycolate oxidase|uniref:FAD-binding oxidoreductase n=1 Tax=Desulfovermiculus halophilus TaxID=339722 RepID=UPI00054E3BEA|nr:FAD-linked oxidase C-terminal domain-containing protein [Desulfovermiculus halophilus]
MSIIDALEHHLDSDAVLSSEEDLLCYAYDATGKSYMPLAVVFPRAPEDISLIMRVANEHRVSVIPRGAGSGMTGGSLPESGGIVLVMTQFDRILEIDTENLVAVVEPGVITSQLHKAVEAEGLFYPPDPASMNFSTLGGNIAENSGGMRAVKYGTTKEYILGLEVVLPSGEIIHTGSKCVKDVVGYNLTQLLVGSEGTLGIVTKAILKLLPLPEAKKTLTATFPSILDAGRTVSEIIRRKIIPTTMEFLDRHAVWCVDQYLQIGLAPGAGAFMLIEVDGDQDQVEKNIAKVREVCSANKAIEIQIAATAEEQDDLWRMRRSVSASLAHFKSAVKINEDIVVPRAKIPEIIQFIESVGERHEIRIVNFGHAGDGNIHLNVLPQNEQLETAHKAVDEIFDRTIELGGRISGEHGIGTSKREYIGKNLEPAAIAAMQAVKRAWDPNNILNPGKIFPE